MWVACGREGVPGEYSYRHMISGKPTCNQRATNAWCACDSDGSQLKPNIGSHAANIILCIPAMPVYAYAESVHAVLKLIITRTHHHKIFSAPFQSTEHLCHFVPITSSSGGS